MTNYEAGASLRCGNGHEVGPGNAFCPACGSPATTQQPLPAPGWYPDETNQTRVRWWDGTTWSAQTQPRIQSSTAARATTKSRMRPVIMLAGAGALLLLVTVAAVVAVARGNKGSHGGSSTPTLAMYDPSASRQEVIDSIRHDFCTSDASPGPDAGGYVYISCQGPSRNGGALFQVYNSPEALQLALNSGAISCMNGETAVLGPTWAANVVNANDAADLVAQGATSGGCN